MVLYRIKTLNWFKLWKGKWSVKWVSQKHTKRYQVCHQSPTEWHRKGHGYSPRQSFQTSQRVSCRKTQAEHCSGTITILVIHLLPVILRYRVWFNLSVHFVSRGLEFHQQLTPESFLFLHDDNGVENVSLFHKTKQKDWQGGLNISKHLTTKECMRLVLKSAISCTWVAIEMKHLSDLFNGTKAASESCVC